MPETELSGRKSRCMGENTLSTKVNEATERFIEVEAREAGVPKAEVMRRLFDLFRDRPEEIREELEL
jgi:hypothetical protein